MNQTYWAITLWWSEACSQECLLAVGIPFIFMTNKITRRNMEIVDEDDTLRWKYFISQFRVNQWNVGKCGKTYRFPFPGIWMSIIIETVIVIITAHICISLHGPLLARCATWDGAGINTLKYTNKHSIIYTQIYWIHHCIAN